MIAKDQNIALLTVGNEALKNADWANYAKYCFDREKGLRKEAFKNLDKFLKSTEAWSLEKKIDFVKFLFPFFENIQEADYGPFTQPLSDKLVKPTLTTWCDNELIDNNPFRWFGKYYRSEEPMYAREIAEELDASSNLIAARGRRLDEKYGYVNRVHNGQIYAYSITEKAKLEYFDKNGI